MEKENKKITQKSDLRSNQSYPSCFMDNLRTTLKKNSTWNQLEPSVLPQWKVDNKRLYNAYKDYLEFSRSIDSEIYHDVKISYRRILNFKHKLEEFIDEHSNERVIPWNQFEEPSPLYLRDSHIITYVEESKINDIETQIGVEFFYKYISTKKLKLDLDDPDHDLKCYMFTIEYIYEAIELAYRFRKAIEDDKRWKKADKEFREKLKANFRLKTAESEREYEIACTNIRTLEDRLFEEYQFKFFKLEKSDVHKQNGFKPAYDIKVIEYRPNYYQLVYTPDNYRQTYVNYSPKHERTEKTQEEIEEARTKYARTAASRIRDIGLSNIWTQFWTLTFDKNKVESRYDYEYLSELVIKWLKNTNRRHFRKFKKKFKYVIVSEFHKDKAIHFHALISDYCYKLGEKQSRYDEKKKKLHVSYPLNEWEYGYGVSMPIEQDTKGENSRNVSLYISKYMTKSLENNPVGFKKNKKMYWSSKGLNKPTKYFIKSDELSADALDILLNQLEPEKFKIFDSEGDVQEQDYLTKKVWDGVERDDEGILQNTYREIDTYFYNLLLEPEQPKEPKDL